MLSMNALMNVTDSGPGYYGRLFLLGSVTGVWGPVINLSHLNEFVQLTLFMIVTVTSVLFYV